MRRLRWFALLATLGLTASCDGILSACVYNGGNGPCDEWVPKQSCEEGGGVYHDATTCSDLGMVAESSSE